jgi:hypothetical protein
VSLTPTPLRRNVFGDSVAEFRFRADAARAVKGKVVWRVSQGTATVKAGEADVTADADAPNDVAIKIAIPPVKDGLVAHWKLTVSVVEPDRKKPSAQFEQDLWVFPPDPFAGRAEWLKNLKITLFDPKVDTAKVLTAAKVPFGEAKSVDALADVKAGVLVVGEGVSFRDEKGLGPALPKVAAAGAVVLILAPEDGNVPVPGVGGPPGGFEEVAFRRQIVPTLDKRLDPDWWPPDGKAIARTLVVKAGDDAVAAGVVPGAAGWPWVEARHRDGRGRWAFCGLAVISKWEAGPTPRFLFARMLEYLTDPGTEQPKKEDGR